MAPHLSKYGDGQYMGVWLASLKVWEKYMEYFLYFYRSLAAASSVCVCDCVSNSVDVTAEYQNKKYAMRISCAGRCVKAEGEAATRQSLA